MAILVSALVSGLGHAGPPDPLDNFEFGFGGDVFADGLQTLADPRHPRRLQAIRAASELGRDAIDAVPHLIAAINEGDSDIRIDAALALRRMRPLSPSDLAALVDLLKSDDANVKGTAAEVLGSMGPDALLAVPGLVDEWKKQKSKPDGLNWNAGRGPAWTFAEAIANIDPSREEVVRELVDNCIQTLTSSDFLSDSPRRAATLLANLTVRDDSEICAALEYVAKLGAGPIHARPGGSAVINDSVALRITAARALSKRRPSPKLVRWLAESVAIEGNANWACCRTVEAIGDLGPAGEPALPQLIQIVEHQPRTNDSEPGYAAIVAIGRIGPAAKSAVPVLISVLERNLVHPDDICAAIRSLGLIGEAAASALPSLQTKLSHGDPEVQIAAADSIRRIGGDTSGTIPVLIAALRVQDIRRLFAGRFLCAKMAAQIRISAAIGLAELGGGANDAIPELIRLIRHDRFPTVRLAAKRAVFKIHAELKNSEATPIVP